MCLVSTALESYPLDPGCQSSALGVRRAVVAVKLCLVSKALENHSRDPGFQRLLRVPLSNASSHLVLGEFLSTQAETALHEMGQMQAVSLPLKMRERL
jgi:hypothetical protein